VPLPLPLVSCHLGSSSPHDFLVSSAPDLNFHPTLPLFFQSHLIVLINSRIKHHWIFILVVLRTVEMGYLGTIVICLVSWFKFYAFSCFHVVFRALPLQCVRTWPRPFFWRSVRHSPGCMVTIIEPHCMYLLEISMLFSQWFQTNKKIPSYYFTFVAQVSDSSL
jgi:hypothetical protein